MSRPIIPPRAGEANRRRLVIAVALSYVATVYGGGWLKGDYNHLTQYVSELNATGTAWAWQIGVFGFGLFGLLCLALLWTTAPVAPVVGISRVGYWLLLAEPVAWIGSALFPCDPGCPVDGSLSQDIHNLLGGITYLVTALALVLLSRSPRMAPKAHVGWLVLAGVWMILFAVMVAPEFAPWRGLLQRLAEILLYGYVCAAAWRLSPAGPELTR